MSTAAPTPLGQARGIARTELRTETRAGEALWIITPFGAVALLLAPMAIGADRPLLAQLGLGMYWVVVLLFGVLVALRQTTTDSPAHLAMLRLTGIPAAARLAGRAAATTVLLLGFEAVLLPVMLALYQPDLAGWPWLAAALPLTATGLAALGTLAGALVQGMAGKSTLGPLLVCPLALPMLLGSTELVTAAGYGRVPWLWLLLLVTVAAIGWLALTIGANALEESS
ncbi:heme exporter protein CcmB [Amycolatopsis saalfeldensis]|uniref:Heme exporter protein B n=1 Tax=Amycolatopsis saalfeldensis TaxID=394193 RepID=A0A1H8YN77_9PSEU|nr:heme exporter protein CcmB [Amycolatopsis saalfeldensis]SEP53533.1 heme exporter protein B [Amycolatopsis saalfeldensis]